jgi:prepilin-type N-terminal cleavage/methylation domain-containing protein/prepilin-type processing-associated H-X9-DG protein
MWFPKRAGMTLVEMLVVIAIIGLLVGLLIPAVQMARESARRAACAGNIRQIGLAFQQHMQAQGHLPFLRGISNYGGPTPCTPSTCSRNSNPQGNEATISGFVYLLPYLDQIPLWDQINTPSNGILPFGPPRDWRTYTPWVNARLPFFLCPTAPPGSAFETPGFPSIERNRRHYAMNMGDRIQTSDSNPALPRGLFGYGSRVTQAHVLDGMSFTIMVAERANGVDSSDIRGLAANNRAGVHLNPSTCLSLASGGRYLPGVSVQANRPLGSLWTNGHAAGGGFNTVLPPNSPSCMNDTWGDASGLFSASSYHLGGGVNVLMADGAIRSIDQTIDCGLSSRPEVTTGPSPYGLWGALGTMRGGEGQGDTW